MTRTEISSDSADILLWRFLLAVSLIAFTGIAVGVVSGGPLAAVDSRASQVLLAHGSAGWTDAMRLLAKVHGVAGISIATGVWVVWLWRLRQTERLRVLLWVVGGGLLLNGALKRIFQRERPLFEAGVQPPLDMLASYSFPSGHVSASTVFYGFVLMMVFARTPHRGVRVAAACAASAMVALIAYNRIYVGAHHLSDVLAAVAEGLAWIALCALLLSRRRLRPST